MSDETESRKPRTPNFDRVIDAIGRGDYDEKIIELHRALAARQDVLKAQVFEQVRQVFGDDAKIVSTKNISMEPMKPIPGLEGDEAKVIVEVDENNPFVKKAERNEEVTRSAPPPPVTSATADQIDEDKVAKDLLENVRGNSGLPISEIEERMMHGERITDFEHRGPIIGGLRARDIAD